MKKDIHELVECDSIAMMEGWQYSKGACLEYQIAMGLKLLILFCSEIK